MSNRAAPARIESATADELCNAVARGETAGIVAGVAVGDEPPSIHACGVAAVGEDRPLESLSQFSVGSVTKQFTATCIFILADRARLSLDDSLETYVPEARRFQRTTISQLLHHTSGLPTVNSRTGEDPFLAVPASKRLLAIDPDAQVRPGERYRYSNLNYWLLGHVIERVAGVPFPQFLHDEVLRPLGMSSSGHDIGSGSVVGHTGPVGDLRRARRWNSEWLGAAAALVSNAPDVLRWDSGLKTLLSEQAFAAMFHPDPATAVVRYAGGWIVSEQNGVPFVWHNGEISGFQAANVLLPSASAAVCVMTNADGLGGATTDPLLVAQDIADHIIGVPEIDTGQDVHRVALELAERRFESNRFTSRLRSVADLGAVRALRDESFGPVRWLRAFAAEPSERGTRYRFNVRYEQHRRVLTFVLHAGGLVDDFSFNVLNREYGPHREPS